MRNILIVVSVVLLATVAPADAEVTLESWDRNVSGVISTDSEGRLQYELSYRGDIVVEKSPLGITFDNVNLGRDVAIGSTDEYRNDSKYPWRGVHSQAIDRHNGVRITLMSRKSRTRPQLEARCFNDGFAFRYIVPGRGTRTVSGEDTAFKLAAASKVWFQTNTSSYEGQYQAKAVEQMPSDKHIGPPMIVELPEAKGYAAITEAALFNYSGMTLKSEGGNSRLFHAAFQDDKTWKLEGEIITPWRVIIVTPDLNGLVNSDIIHNLNDPPAKELATAKWIRPGRAFWHWWSGTIGNWDSVAFDRQFEWIDRAAEFGFEYYLVDAGWEFTWKKPGKDEWDLLKELCDYAAGKDVGVFVWKRWNTGKTEGVQMTGLDSREKRLDFFARCRKAGVVGVKIDYMNSESKKLIDFYTDVLKDAIDYEIMINFHGANKPTGESRTYPHEVTREGIIGLEYNKWSSLPPKHYASLPFTRLIAGHGDFTPCTFNPKMLKGTTFALQLACAVCYTSPVMHYADKPELYLRSPAADVIKAIPSVWVETKVLPGSKIGDLAVMARRKNRTTWFVGIINGGGKQTYELDLSFLPGGRYASIQLADNPERPDDLVRSEQKVTPSDKIKVNMNEGGGFVAMFKSTR
ncbi:MAG: glycoside hydrolase family 97 protein [Planctomycetota bacterium]